MYDYDIGIIDYGLNNLKSISKAFEKIGKKTKVIDTPEEIRNSKCLVLPGVGAYEDGMKGLDRGGLIIPLKEQVSKGTPLLGICLGMQMLFSRSQEFGMHEGLDLLSGEVIPFKPPAEVNKPGYKVPHVGWNNLCIPSMNPHETLWEKTLLRNTQQNANVYFVHSFYPKVNNPAEVIATSEHGGQEFAAAVMKGNVTGTQFHPEKSGSIGIQMLKVFCEMNDI